MTTSETISWAVLIANLLAIAWLAATELRSLADEDDEPVSR